MQQAEKKKNNTESFVQRLEKEILFIRIFLYSRIPQAKKEEFNSYEQVYEIIALQIKNGTITDELAPSIYNQFLRTLKRFKRHHENVIKHNERDIDAFRKKYESTGQTILAVINEIKLNPQDKMDKFDIKDVLQFNFPMHLYTNKELCEIAYKMIQHTGLAGTLGVEEATIMGLIDELAVHYNVIPYHNWTHAFQLFHMFFTSYFTSSFKNLIEPFEFFIGMISALAHDLNHKGVNNLYKVKRYAKNSLRYAEQGVLENMHVSTFFQISHNNPKLDIFAAVKEPAKVAKFKKLLTSNILATDMGRHGLLVDQLKLKTEAILKLKSNPDSKDKLDNYLAFSSTKEADREFLSNIMVHACDIGNPCYNYDNYMNWCYLLSQEFQDQTLKEEQRGIPVSTFLQYTTKPAFKKGQIFFSNTFVVPLWKGIIVLLPELQSLDDTLQKNLKILAE